MRKVFTAALAALSLAAGTAAATSADARSRYYRSNDASTAIIAGAAGIALGTAIANRGYGRGYYGYGYRYDRPRYGYGYGYGYPGPRYGYGYDRYNRGYYGPRSYRAPRARTCTFWQYDRWGRPYQVRGWC
jgi:hypothetical protein